MEIQRSRRYIFIRICLWYFENYNLPYRSIIPFILPYAECVNFDLSWIHGWLETMRTRMMVGLRQIWHFGLYLLFLIRHILHSWVVWNNNNYRNALKQFLLHWSNTTVVLNIVNLYLENQSDLQLLLIANLHKRILNASILNMERIVFAAKCNLLLPINNDSPEKV